MRGTFANIRIRNEMVPGVEGGYTRHIPSGEQLAIYDAAMKYQQEGTPLAVIAGKEYGSGSSRDWAAKGPRLQGVRVVVVQTLGMAVIAALIGAGGFGAIIFQGLLSSGLDLVLLGVIPVIALAVVIDALFRLLISLLERTHDSL